MIIVFLLRNLLAQIMMFILISILTLVSYFYSFVSTRDQMLKVLTFGFIYIRKIIFFIMGITLEYRGLENLLNTPCIIASKHQSSLESSFLFNEFFLRTLYAFKKEITYVPMWGRINMKCGGLKIDRSKGIKILDVFVADGKKYINLGYNVAIFPEGTRTPVEVKNGKFKMGVARLYKECNVPIIPVALNSGICYPKGSWLIYSGHIIVEFLKPIYPGMEEKTMLLHLQEIVNKRSNELAEESLARKSKKFS